MRSLLVDIDSSLKIVELPKPEIDKTSVLVKTLACGICSGTDSKIIHGKFKNIPLSDYPTLLGHETVGEVVEVGSEVTSFKPGDKIVGQIIMGKMGGYSSYWGGFSEYGVCVDPAALIRNGMGPGTQFWHPAVLCSKLIPDDFDPVGSVMILTMREVLSAMYMFGLTRGESLAVFGAGPVGLTFIKFAKILGLGPVISIVRNAEKAAEAEKAGADYIINSNVEDVVKAVRRICPGGVDNSLDAVGNNSLVSMGMEIVRDNGKILVYGISSDLSMNLNWSNAPYNWKLHFYQMPDKEREAAAHEQVVNWIRMGIIDPMDYISHVFDFKDILNGFELVENHIPHKKIVIKY